MHQIENLKVSDETLQVSDNEPDDSEKVIILDSMAVLSHIKTTTQTITCRDLAELLNKHIKFQTNGYREVQVIFDSYKKNSI